MKNCRLEPSILLLSLALISSSCSLETITAAKERRIQNLRAFAKLYGYVKYFHPSDEASSIDWDKLAIYGAQRVEGAKSPEDLKAILEELFIPIAPTIQIYEEYRKPVVPSYLAPSDTAGLKVVAWQHMGFGSLIGGSAPYIYKSIRINRDNALPASGYGGASIAQSVDANIYRGKEINLKAHMRTNANGMRNAISLWMMIFNEDGSIHDFSTPRDLSVEPTQWQEYHIVERVPDDAGSIFFGCLIRGAGRLWVDQFQLFARDQGAGWEPVDVRNAGFEEGQVGDKPTAWQANRPGYSYALTGENPREGKMCLLIENEVEIFTGKLFEEHPEVGEVINAKLDAGLACQVPLALYSNNSGTIGTSSEYPFDEFVSALDVLSTEPLSGDNKYVRLAGTLITWNVFQHFYPYFDVVKVDWDQELTSALGEALDDSGAREYLYTLRALVAKIQDGHGRVTSRIVPEMVSLPLVVDWIEDQVVITVPKDTSNFQRGDIVLAMDGVRAEQVLLNEEQFISGSPQWKRHAALRWFGYGEKGSVVTLTLERAGEIIEVEVERAYVGQVVESKEFSWRSRIHSLTDDIYYVDLARISMEDFTEILNDLVMASGIVFDLREELRYEVGLEVISHLIDKPVTSPLFGVPLIIYPDRKAITYDTSGTFDLTPKEPRITAKTAFLVNSGAGSHMETFMGFVEGYRLGEIVGQVTCGVNGNANYITLPDGTSIQWTGVKVLKPDGSQHHLVGIQPTISVQRTIQGVVEGRDEFLEKALEVIRSHW